MLTFVFDATHWTAWNDPRMTLRTHPEGYTMTFRDGRREEYNLAGQLIEDVDPAGLVTTYTYANGTLQKITGPYGHYLLLSFNSANRPVIRKNWLPLFSRLVPHLL